MYEGTDGLVVDDSLLILDRLREVTQKAVQLEVLPWLIMIVHLCSAIWFPSLHEQDYIFYIFRIANVVCVFLHSFFCFQERLRQQHVAQRRALLHSDMDTVTIGTKCTCIVVSFALCAIPFLGHYI